ncbi:hypothetical protein Arub01_23200 [Actinomadura rubrobrunea]|uniref:Xylanase n=1 Tax=Actinomadura rubrobrunea TaxID=115335 RepID=A0A9W6PVQ4_9ACTN|nr:glycoside hydrolase [Actinomadura rubrobrunea]GLW64076.1 hypothetical protein Arub01_23200 [Actinomadura rubrobrunea]
MPIGRPRRIATVLTAAACLGAVTAVPAQAAATGGSVRFSDRLQPIDGFGISIAFQRATLIRGARGLSPEKGREVMDLLLSKDKGAGLSIIRLGIGSSADDVYDHMKSIQPEDPGGPDAPPKYVWDGDDGGQVWFAKEAKKYGVTRFYANAWSAPAYMKTNGDDANGGYLCGLSGTDCESGDWRKAYAKYLVKFAEFYKKEGIRISDLAFTNEPDYTASYASMLFTPAQAVEFTKILGPVARKAGLGVICCEHTGWMGQLDYTRAIEADPEARRYITTYTGHRYSSSADQPQPTRKHTWMSEWNPDGATWNENWDDGSGSDGMTIAEDIHHTLTTGSANGYLYWLGASLGATRAFIQIADPGDSYRVSKRLWAMAAYSRFIRPGAHRVRATAADPDVKISAFRNADGSRVVEILNTGAATRADLALDQAVRRPAAYVTDSERSLARADVAAAKGKRLSVDLAPRSLTTVVIR